jgi:large subunit ribosomal protein L7/L12
MDRRARRDIELALVTAHELIGATSAAATSVVELSNPVDDASEPATTASPPAPPPMHLVHPETNTFSVALTEVPADRNISIIKTIRTQLPGLSRVDAKSMIEELPSLIVQGVSRARADAIRQELESAGATAEVRGAL